jgi:hypothetical protein
MNHEGSSFLSAVAIDIDVLCCAKEADGLAAQGKRNTTLFRYSKQDEKQWLRVKPAVAWTAVGMAHYKNASNGHVIMAVSPKGEVLQFELTSQEATTTVIPNAGASLRTARNIGDTVWVVGMGRKAFKLTENQVWLEVGPSPNADDGANIIGFEDVDGFGADDVYAVGWRGEVWRQVSGQWRQLDRLTKRNLTAVCCVPNGAVYAVGQKGTILSGRGDSWQAIDSGISANLMDVSEFDGVVYACTDHMILKLQDGKFLPEDRFEDERRPATCLHLLKTIGGVYAVGPKDIFLLQGGLWRHML